MRHGRAGRDIMEGFDRGELDLDIEDVDLHLARLEITMERNRSRSWEVIWTIGDGDGPNKG